MEDGLVCSEQREGKLRTEERSIDLGGQPVAGAAGWQPDHSGLSLRGDKARTLCSPRYREAWFKRK